MRSGRLVRRAAIVGAVGGGALLAFYVLPITDSRPQAIDVVMTEYAFDPQVIDAVEGQHLRIVNEGAVRHSLLIVGLGKGVELPPGAEADLRLPIDGEGDYPLVCDLPGHADAGMTGRISIAP